MTRVDRRTVDLSAYPDLIVIILGMRVNAWTGLKTLFGLGPQIAKSAKAQPDGLLLHEDFLFSLFLPHAGMRQYWRDFESLDTFRTASRLVVEFSARFGRHRILARNLFHPPRDRGHLR